jgi:hypothetical protein
VRSFLRRYIKLIDADVAQGNWGDVSQSAFHGAIILLIGLALGYFIDDFGPIGSPIAIGCAVIFVLLYVAQLWRIGGAIRQQWREEREARDYMKNKYDG